MSVKEDQLELYKEPTAPMTTRPIRPSRLRATRSVQCFYRKTYFGLGMCTHVISEGVRSVAGLGLDWFLASSNFRTRLETSHTDRHLSVSWICYLSWPDK